MTIREIDPREARELLDDGNTLFVDIRDPRSHELSHIPGSVHLSNASVTDFLDTTARDQRLVVYCYHGNSSRDATAFLQEQGFTDVASMAGGFEYWRLHFPENISA